MYKQTVVDQVEVTSSGVVQVRFRKEIVDDKDVHVLYHRTVIEPGTAVDDQMSAVNAHLEKLGYPSVADVSRVKDIVYVAHTKDVVDAWKAKSAA